MSESVRQEIATAASTVDGVNLEAYYRANVKVGTGGLSWLRTEYPNKFGGEDYWGVLVNLPNDPAAAEAWIEEHKAALVGALKGVLVVTAARPEIVTSTDNPSQKVLTIEGHRESEE